MRYYKQIDANGQLLMIGTGLGGVEITAEEYDALSAEIANTDWTGFAAEEVRNVDTDS
jgi:hypothetical protein